MMTLPKVPHLAVISSAGHLLPQMLDSAIASRLA